MGTSIYDPVSWPAFENTALNGPESQIPVRQRNF